MPDPYPLPYPVVVLDTETGGFDPKTTSVLTLAVATRMPGGEVVAPHEWKIKHDVYQVTPGALQVNGIDLIAHDQAATPLSQVSQELAAYLKRARAEAGGEEVRVCGHNVPFDLAFVHEQLIPQPEWRRLAHYGTLDTKGIADLLRLTGRIGAGSSKLEEVARSLGITYDAHRALDDVLATAKVLDHFLHLLRGDQ